MKTLKLALLAAAMLATATAAKAETFFAQSLNIIGGENVAMTSPVVQTVVAGQYQLIGGGPDAGTSFLVWCLGLTTGINLPYLYNVNTFAAGDIFPGIPNLDATQTRQVASLINFGQNGGFGGGDPDGKAAIQLAIWKAEYGNLFQPVGLTAAQTTDMNLALALTIIGAADDCPTCVLKVFTDAPIVQSQPFGLVVVNPVPLPAAVWLFGSALGLGGLLMRKKQPPKKGEAHA